MSTIAPQAKRQLNIFIAEDSALPAEDLKLCCEELGHKVIGPVPSLSQGLSLFDASKIDLGLLDITLREDKVFPLAARFLAENIPFIFLTGYNRDILPPEFAEALLLEKPLDQRQLVKCIEMLNLE